MSVFIASNLFCGGPTSAECFVSNPVLSKLTSFSRQEVHRRLWQILGRAEKSLMPRKRVAMVEVVVVVRGICGGIMGRWRCLRCRATTSHRCHRHLPGTGAELAAAAETLLPHPAMAAFRSDIRQRRNQSHQSNPLPPHTCDCPSSPLH